MFQASGASPSLGQAARGPLHPGPCTPNSATGLAAEPWRRCRWHVKISACCFGNIPLAPFPPGEQLLGLRVKGEPSWRRGAWLMLLQCVRALHWPPWPLLDLSGVSLLPASPLRLLHLAFLVMVWRMQTLQTGQATS